MGLSFFHSILTLGVQSKVGDKHPPGGGYSLRNLLHMCSLRRECPLRQIAKKAPIIDEKFTLNRLIMGKNWVILKENSHFLPQVEVKFPPKYP